jgi:hypothetical protein
VRAPDKEASRTPIRSGNELRERSVQLWRKISHCVDMSGEATNNCTSSFGIDAMRQMIIIQN